MDKELAKVFTTAIVKYIDSERSEGTMCCSNVECERLEKALEEDEYKYVEAFINKKLSRLTEFEKKVADIIDLWHEDYVQWSTPGASAHNYPDQIKPDAAELLALAREQFIKDGYIIEKKAFHDAVEKVDPEVMKEVSDNVDKENELAKKHLEGYINGREDTLREMKDFIESHFNTQSGTSALKEDKI